MARMSDAEARQVILAAFAQRGITPNLAATQAVQAIGRFEGAYGSAFGGWKNWGAVQCRASPPCPPNCVELTDTHADGTPYRWCYRVYPSHVDGAADLIRELYRRDGVPQALAAGDADRIANRMRAAGYFEAPESRYAKAIENNARDIAASLGEPRLVRRGGPGPGAPGPGTRPSSSGGSLAGPILFAAFLFGIARWKTNARRTRY